MKTINKIGMAVIEDNRFLIVRNKGTKLFLMPGGSVEGDESDLQALAREIQEELTINIDTYELKYVGEYEDIAANNPDSIVRIKLYYGKIKGPIKIANEIDEYRWFDPNASDWNILSAIIKNKILPDLIDRKYIVKY